MKPITVNVERVKSMTTTPWDEEISIELVMTEHQMLNAVKSFLGHINDSTWYEWVKELSPEILKDEDEDA